ncbi:MAG: hypothetical protein M2R45_03380 [Verrucomicrobia subdivision 3 bacterium]|nr:hypothetical protein [Limisphaerales bacterium]MCS1416707.1 hypothetical protein [Limisphaerales bacterium]
MIAETTALGAAYLAGLSAGYWKIKPRSQNNGRSTLDSSPPWKRRCAIDFMWIETSAGAVETVD